MKLARQVKSLVLLLITLGTTDLVRKINRGGGGEQRGLDGHAMIRFWRSVGLSSFAFFTPLLALDLGSSFFFPRIFGNCHFAVHLLAINDMRFLVPEKVNAFVVHLDVRAEVDFNEAEPPRLVVLVLHDLGLNMGLSVIFTDEVLFKIGSEPCITRLGRKTSDEDLDCARRL